jgi:hypothetical protein
MLPCFLMEQQVRVSLCSDNINSSPFLRNICVYMRRNVSKFFTEKFIKILQNAAFFLTMSPTAMLWLKRLSSVEFISLKYIDFRYVLWFYKPHDACVMWGYKCNKAMSLVRSYLDDTIQSPNNALQFMGSYYNEIIVNWRYSSCI